MLTRAALARMIDHTALKPETTPAMIDALCTDALGLGTASVCVPPTFVDRAAARLSGSPVLVCTVIGFPWGYSASAAKAAETRIAIEQGAREIDMVIAVGRLIAGEHDAVRADIKAVVEATRASAPAGAHYIVKVIFETALLSNDQIATACRLSVDAGADYVKTSTGFASAGATVEHVRLMRDTVGPNIGVKASGGVRTLEAAQAMLEAGATRIGTSSTKAILDALPR